MIQVRSKGRAVGSGPREVAETTRQTGHAGGDGDALGVAMLSFAHTHADGYARQVRDHPRTRLVAVWDEDANRGRAAAQRYGVPFEPELEAVLARADVAGVVCTAPSALHPQVLLASARAGRHIFTEKVLALTVADCDRILEAVQAAGVRLTVSMPALCDAELRWLKAALDAERFGRVTMLRVRIGHSAALERWFPPSSWFGDPGQAGGGALMDLGCHPVYRMRHLMGEPLALTARLTNVAGTYGIDDNGAVLLEFPGGALGIVEASWVQRGGPEGLALYGTAGWALLGYPGAPLRCGGEAFTGGQGGSLLPGNLPPAWRPPLQQWIEAVLDGTEPELRPEWGRHLTEILQAAYTSNRDGCTVRWPVG